MEKMKKILVGCLLVLFVVGVGFVTMADVANATEMSAYQENMKLNPLGAKQEYVAVRPGGDIEAQCESYCLDNPLCVAIYYREGESKCYYYSSYGFSLYNATGYGSTFKIWTN